MRTVLCVAFLVAVLVPVLPSRAEIPDEPAVAVRAFNDTGRDAERPQGLEVETENLFGFTLGSDTDKAGSWSTSLEAQAAIGVRSGRTAATGGKLEIGYGLTESVSVSGNLLAGWWDIGGVEDLQNRNVVRFNGVGAELRWRLLERGPSPVGLTLDAEPAYLLNEDMSGAPGHGWGSENKLILDAELMPDRLWGAVNLIYDIETFRPRGESTERASVGGVSTAMSVPVLAGLFVGIDLRYLRAYEGLGCNRFVGQAFYVGPTLFWQFSERAWVAATWLAQVAGRETDFALDLASFSRQLVRVKLGMEF